MDVSVVIVTYHTGPALWLAIDSVLAQPECRELFIVGNGNVPGVEKRLHALEEKESRVILLTGHGNIGFAKACNLGARHAAGDYILLLNPDSMLPEGGLARALSILGAYPDNTLAGCFLMNPDGSEQRGCRRALLTPRNAVAESVGLEWLLAPERRLDLRGIVMPNMVYDVPAISGAFMMLRRGFYEKLGGLDEGYFLHMEDMDLCYRVHQEGGNVIMMPEVKVIHFRSTSEAPSAFVERHKARGFIRYLQAHFSGKKPPFFWAAVKCGIWLRYGIKRAINVVDKLFVPPLAAKNEIARSVLIYRTALYCQQDRSLAGKTILVTGASGQVGLCVVGKALAKGAQVIALYHSTSVPFDHPRLRWVQGDLNDAATLPEDMEADILIHTAALWLLPPVLPALFDMGVRRVIAFGSTSIMGKSGTRNAHEKEIVSKLEASESDVMRISADHMRDASILRPTMIYGVALDNNITKLADVVRRFGFLALYKPASGRRHPVQVQDLADATLAMIDNPATFGKTYNLGGRQVMMYRTMAETLFDYLGKKPRIIFLPLLPLLLDILGKLYQFSHINGEIAHRMNRDLVFDIEEAIHDFGYSPHGFLEGDAVI